MTALPDAEESMMTCLNMSSYFNRLTEGSKGFTGSSRWSMTDGWMDRIAIALLCISTTVLMYDKKYGNTLQMNTYEAQKGQYLYLYHNKEG